jgi:hypothetical protein
MVASTKGLGPQKDSAGKVQQNIQKTDTSSRQRGRPHKKQDRNCQTVINIWSCAPDGARHQDLLADWPSVAMWLWLWIEFTQSVREWVRGLLRFSPCELLLLEAGSWGTGIVREPRGRGTSAVGSRYRASAKEDWEDIIRAVVTVIFGVGNSVRLS